MKPIVATVYTSDLNGKPFQYTYLYSDAAHAAIAENSSLENADTQCVAAGRPDLVGKFGNRGKLGFAPLSALVSHLTNGLNDRTIVTAGNETFTVIPKGFDPVQSLTLLKETNGHGVPVITGSAQSVVNRLLAFQ